MAKELIEAYGLKQNQVAKALGISQSAVSKYTKKVRGHIIEINHIEEIQPLINKIIGLLMDGNVKRAEFIKLFCQTCTAIRQKGLMCQFCRKTDRNIEECSFCLNYSPYK